jgi:hypothetical protein
MNKQTVGLYLSAAILILSFFGFTWQFFFSFVISLFAIITISVAIGSIALETKELDKIFLKHTSFYAFLADAMLILTAGLAYQQGFIFISGFVFAATLLTFTKSIIIYLGV